MKNLNLNKKKDLGITLGGEPLTFNRPMAKEDEIMEIIAVFDRTICEKGGLVCGNTTVAPKGWEKTIENFVFTLGRRWGKQEIKRDMKNPCKKNDFENIENVYEHLRDLEGIRAMQDAEAAFLVGFIWGKLYPNPPKDARLKRVLNETIKELKKVDVLPRETKERRES